MDLREEFVLKATDSLTNMSELCSEYGISRKTGYKWLERYKKSGAISLQDLSRRPERLSKTSAEVVLRLVELKKMYPRWGAKKLRELLRRQLGAVPSAKTVHRIMKRLELPPARVTRVRNTSPVRTRVLLAAEAPNDVWTADFKGWWRTRNGERYEMLMVRDLATRFILLAVNCSTQYQPVRNHFENLFKQYGVPKVIRVDNGIPFAAVNAPGGLSRLSAWWTSLGIEVSFSRPGKPQDNGSHERTNGDIALELQLHPEANIAQQQRRVDEWVNVYNYVRPHEALKMKSPGALYRRSKRRLKAPRKPVYPPDAIPTRVSNRGRVGFNGFHYFVGMGLSGQTVGIRRYDEKLHLHFYELHLGTINSTPQRRH